MNGKVNTENGPQIFSEDVVRTKRQFFDPTCTTCVAYKGKRFPFHDPDDKCESGGHTHCSCSVCW